MPTMDDVYAIFDFLVESTWISCDLQNIYVMYERKNIPEYITTFEGSTWAEQLYNYKEDILAEGLIFISVPEMKEIYLASK